MFVYHGIVDQTTAGGVEFMFAVLPTIVEIGAPFILLRYHAKKESSEFTASEYYTDAQIDAASIAPDETSATFTAGGVTLHLPRDMKVLHVQLQDKSSATTVTSSMSCIMKQPVTEADAKSHEPAMFAGPMEIDGQFYGNVIALVMYRKGINVSTPVRICMSWNHKTATGGPPPTTATCQPEEKSDEGPDNESTPLQFSMNNESHHVRAKMGANRDSLQLSMRQRYDHPLTESCWQTFQLASLERPKETLRKMISHFYSFQTMTIKNTQPKYTDLDKDAVFLCTITDEAVAGKNEFLTHAGLFLAVVGLCAGVPALPSSLGIAAAVGSMVLAEYPYVDMILGGSEEKTALLYPGDSVRANGTGWVGSKFRVDLVQRYIDEHGNLSVERRALGYDKMKIKQRSITKMTEVVWGYGHKSVLSTLNLATYGGMDLIAHRLLFIEQLQVVNLNPWTDRVADVLEVGALIEGDTSGGIGYRQGRYYYAKYWAQLRQERGRKMFFSSPGQRLAIVQWLPGSLGDDIGRMENLPDDPFTPVLMLKNMEMVPSDRKRLRQLGAMSSWDDALKEIQTFEADHHDDSSFKLWGYSYGYLGQLWACPLPDDKLQYDLNDSRGDRVYFPIRHWVPTTVLKGRVH